MKKRKKLLTRMKSGRLPVCERVKCCFVVNGFAGDNGGRMRDSVGVIKHKGRRVGEKNSLSIIGTQIDPQENKIPEILVQPGTPISSSCEQIGVRSEYKFFRNLYIQSIIPPSGILFTT